MADTVSCTYNFALTVENTLDVSEDLIANPIVNMVFTTNAVVKAIIDGSSTVPATTAWGKKQALSGGTATLDLEALARDNLPNLNLNGLRPQILFLFGSTANTAGISVAAGATNGHNILGASDGKVTILPGCLAMFFWNDKLDDVVGADSEVDLVGTGTETLEIIIVAG